MLCSVDGELYSRSGGLPGILPVYLRRKGSHLSDKEYITLAPVIPCSDLPSHNYLSTSTFYLLHLRYDLYYS